MTNYLEIPAMYDIDLTPGVANGPVASIDGVWECTYDNHRGQWNVNYRPCQWTLDGDRYHDIPSHLEPAFMTALICAPRGQQPELHAGEYARVQDEAMQKYAAERREREQRAAAEAQEDSWRG